METQPQIKQPKQKKKMRYFETYISKVLKEISEDNGIKSNAKQQLNSVLCIICEEISRKVLDLTRISRKKTLSTKEIRNVVQLIMTGELANNAIEQGQIAADNFGDTELKHTSRQTKARILFPPSVTEKFLRDFEMSKVMVTGDSSIYLAAVLEYLCREILDPACSIANDYKRKRISVRDLQLSVKGDPELDYLFNNLHISFLGGGVVPYIHPILLNKKGKKKKKTQTTKEENTNKKHRFRPGTVALREIRKNQKNSDSLTFAKQPFERLVRSIVMKYNPEMKISKDVFIILQYFIEQYIIDVVKNAGDAAIHANRVKILPCDISFVCKCKGIADPLRNNERVEILSISNQDSDIDDMDEEDIDNIINEEDLEDELEHDIQDTEDESSSSDDEDSADDEESNEDGDF